MAGPSLEETPVPGLLVLRLPVHRDERGWFEELWQRERMVGLGLPDFGPVQSNAATSRVGVTRGIHAEPWDKLVSVARGRAFGAWVDMREGPGLGATFHAVLEPGVAVFVPRGVGNAYQVLEDETVYTYLVNEHWSPEAAYVGVDVGDPALAIPWPLPISGTLRSPKDRDLPPLAETTGIAPRRPIVLGAGGQLAAALGREFPEARVVGRDELDITAAEQVAAWPWADHDVVLNAAAYTAVDEAETPAGRAAAWEVNAQAPARLAALARRHGFLLVHYSTDYVFAGDLARYDEGADVAPLGVYGQSKAAGDLAVAAATRHYVLRTSWLVGDGHSFVRTMIDLADAGVSPLVVGDQVGRLTFADDLARATRHLVDTGAAFGTYNCTGDGPPMSWADVSRVVFASRGRSVDDVTAVSTDRYRAGRRLAPRPPCSVLDLARLKATGFRPADAAESLGAFLARA